MAVAFFAPLTCASFHQVAAHFTITGPSKSQKALHFAAAARLSFCVRMVHGFDSFDLCQLRLMAMGLMLGKCWFL